MESRRSLTLLAALLVLGVHLSFLPRTLEDIDSINFALGVESFDVVAHRPHPPGYPIFIAAAKLSTAAVGVVRPSWDRDRRAAVGLALWGILALTLAWFVLPRWWELVGLRPWPAWWATVLSLTSPLMWLTASRPLSDAPGLVAALLVQAMLLAALRGVRDGTSLARWYWAVFAAGFIIGVRSQTLWLTMPFVLWGLLLLVRQRRTGGAVIAVVAGAAGVLTWFVPMVVFGGGIGPYVQALGSQGAEDFAGVEMLARSFTARQLNVALSQTFVAPWQWRTLAHVVVGLALIGAWRLTRRQRPALAVVLLGFVPYCLFHLAFHETVTIRYALPLVVPVAGLAVVALSALGGVACSLVVVGLTTVSLTLVSPLLATYASDGAPVFRAFQDMQGRRVSESAPPLLAMHHQVWWGVRRVLDWYRPVWDPGPQPFPGDREWLRVVEHFRTGGSQPVWFLAYLSRTDLAAFDPRTTTVAGRYELNRDLRTLMGGARLDSMQWWAIQKPGWMLGRGWALTPELAGMTAQDRANGLQPSTRAFLVRQPGRVSLVIGGRYLGPDDGPAAEVVATIDGATIATWTTVPRQRWFVHWIDVPGGTASGPGPYAVVDVRVSASSGGAPPPVGFEQFDAAGEGGFVRALTDGWHEPEEDPSRGLSWRWTTARSTIEVRGAFADLTLHLAGESPLKYFDQPPVVVVRAGERVLTRFRPSSDFSEVVSVPGDALRAAGGVITVETDRTFRPSDAGSSPDHRVLGLRLYDISLR